MRLRLLDLDRSVRTLFHFSLSVVLTGRSIDISLPSHSPATFAPSELTSRLNNLAIEGPVGAKKDDNPYFWAATVV
jgi:hypothetical protein